MIEIGKVGWIRSGDDAGKYVKVQELPDSPSSFLILLAYDSGFSRRCGDYWVEDRESLKAFFDEGQWVVEWGGPGQ
ncbi:hypothetical protein [Streptomyces sp. YS-3]|uniref:hypothetical protein n=1 Tax=Streptomyces sp. YS-3 TaxID=3381352 RepID=UPI0038629E66